MKSLTSIGTDTSGIDHASVLADRKRRDDLIDSNNEQWMGMEQEFISILKASNPNHLYSFSMDRNH